jgi:hypothetical protein
MKIIIGIVIGIFLVLIALFTYSKIPTPQHAATLNLLQQHLILPQYSHEAEGRKLQSIEMIEDEEYKSTEGNEASLYQLKDQCKLTLEIYGESFQSKRSFTFIKIKLYEHLKHIGPIPMGDFMLKNAQAFARQQSYFMLMNPEIAIHSVR